MPALAPHARKAFPFNLGDNRRCELIRYSQHVESRSCTMLYEKLCQGRHSGSFVVIGRRLPRFECAAVQPSTSLSLSIDLEILHCLLFYGAMLMILSTLFFNVGEAST